MLLSGVSGLSSTIGCRVCRDCRDCRATVGVSLTVHARGACREIHYSLSGAVGLLSVLSGVGAVGTVERLSGSCRVRVSECRARAQLATAPKALATAPKALATAPKALAPRICLEGACQRPQNFLKGAFGGPSASGGLRPG